MSISKRVAKLENMLSEYDSIFYKLEELKNPIVGEVFAESNDCFLANSYAWRIYPTKNNILAQFYSFTEKEVEDRVDGNIKIRGSWFSEKDVIFYKDIYNKQKEIIKTKNNKKDV